MMPVPQRPALRSPASRSRASRSRATAWLALLLAAVTLLAAGCARLDATGPAPTPDGLQVLGLYEITFDDIGSDAMTASIRRVDDGLAPQALGTTPQTGITLGTPPAASKATAGSQVKPGGSRTYIWAEFPVTNGSGADIDGLTFLGYSSTSGSLDGTAFRVAEDATQTTLTATDILPSGKFQVAANGPSRPELLPPYAMNVVAYSETEIGPLQTQLTNDYSFVNTVFPYGFAATSATASDSDRTITAGATGSVVIGFNAPALDRVVWRGVAVLDDSVRIASPTLYNYRDGGDGFQQFLDLAESTRTNNGLAAGDVEAVVLGEMNKANETRLLPAPYDCGSFSYVELADVRIAGGYTDGTGTLVPEHHWIGGATANTLVTPVEDATTGVCNP